MNFLNCNLGVLCSTHQCPSHGCLCSRWPRIKNPFQIKVEVILFLLDMVSSELPYHEGLCSLIYKNNKMKNCLAPSDGVFCLQVRWNIEGTRLKYHLASLWEPK